MYPNRKPKPFWTVRDFTRFAPALARCSHCGSNWTVDLQHCPIETKIVDIEPRLACSVCGNRDANSISALPRFPVDEMGRRLKPIHASIRMLQERALASAANVRLDLSAASIEDLEAEAAKRGLTLVEVDRVREYDVRDLARWANGQSKFVTVIKPS